MATIKPQSWEAQRDDDVKSAAQMVALHAYMSNFRTFRIDNEDSVMVHADTYLNARIMVGLHNNGEKRMILPTRLQFVTPDFTTYMVEASNVDVFYNRKKFAAMDVSTLRGMLHGAAIKVWRAMQTIDVSGDKYSLSDTSVEDISVTFAQPSDKGVTDFMLEVHVVVPVPEDHPLLLRLGKITGTDSIIIAKLTMRRDCKTYVYAVGHDVADEVLHAFRVDCLAGIAYAMQVGANLQRGGGAPCHACGVMPVKVHRCARCYAAIYCDAVCMSAHAKAHKKQCRAERLVLTL